MNYFIDFIPNHSFTNKLDELTSNLNNENNIVLNMYIKQLPSMNINKAMYLDIEESINNIIELKKKNYKINIMLDTYCFGNKEFTKMGKEIFEILDKLFQYNIDYITVTNNFLFNYVKRRYSNIKIIISEYSDIINVQKICRYIENIKADGVKLDLKLSTDKEKMKYIKENFDINCIHINTNVLYYNNDIYKDALNNSLSHYIQENKWDKAKECLEEYKQKQNDMKNERLYFKKEDYIELRKMGYQNFWFYYNINDDNEYIEKIEKLVDLA